MSLSRGILIGAQYYRPPNPPKADWARDLQRMKSAGMNTVKLWACWSWMNPAEGQYDFDDIDALMDLAHAMSLGVVINVILEDAPYWLEQKLPESRYCDSEGRSIHLGAAMNTPGGGWPGLCFDNSPVVASGLAFLAAVVERYRQHPALLMWDVWNEPHLEPASYFPERIYCYCQASVARFRGWLGGRHGSIDALNAAWARRFSDWSQVEPPRLFEAVPDMLDWREFWFWNLRQWLDARVATARTAGAHQPVTTHVALSGFTGQLATHTLDEWTLGNAVDGFGTSSFPTWLMKDDPVEHLFSLDTARSAAAGRPFLQTELQGGRGRRDGRQSTPHPRPAIITLEMWNAIAAGAGGVLFWQWRPEILGPESPGYGLCAVDGSPTARVEAVASFAALVARVPDLRDSSPVPAPLGLLVSRRTALHAFATDRTIDIYRRSIMGAYRLLIDANIPVDILHEDEIEAVGVQAHVKTLYHPMPAVVSDRLAERLVAWVAGGGRLVSEAAPGEYDARGWHRLSTPPGPLREVFGVTSIETDAISSDTVFSLGEARLRGAWMRDDLAVIDASVIGKFDDGAPAATLRRTGEGQAILFASCPSVAYDLTGDPATRTALAALLGAPENGPIRVPDPAPRLMTRRLRLADGRAAIFILNWTEAVQIIAAESPGTLYRIEGSSSLVAGARPEIPALSGAVFVADVA